MFRRPLALQTSNECLILLTVFNLVTSWCVFMQFIFIVHFLTTIFVTFVGNLANFRASESSVMNIASF
jgi:hypothetical protein